MVCSAVAPKFTVAPLAKPFPEAVIVKGPIPTSEGEIEVSCGVEFRIVAVAVALSDELEIIETVIVAKSGLGICSGAVYSALKPAAGVIVPTVEIAILNTIYVPSDRMYC